MTNTNTLSVLAILAATACSTSTAAPPEKVYDFAPRPLTGTLPAASSPTGAKGQMRRALDQLQPKLALCARGTAGELDITLRLEIAVDQPPVIGGVDVAYPDAAVAACARDVLAAIDLTGITAREHAVWVMHAPFDISSATANK